VTGKIEDAPMLRLTVWLSIFAALCIAPASAAEDNFQPSQCMAIADALPDKFQPIVVPAAFSFGTASAAEEVTITYAGHSTYVIETPGGVRIATDYSGVYGTDPLPRIITMNKAHSSHFTSAPNPMIEYVLRGWDPSGVPAKHNLVVDDVYIRNVTTDIRSAGAMEADGNSIFIFEVADLCIGHLGHLHHMLDNSDYAAIGRLDILMVPIDGGLTLSHKGMADIVNRLQSSIVLPMHRRFTSVDAFLANVKGLFDVRFANSNMIKVSLRTLPKTPTILVPDGL
jgi:L-ascorbate metabolism protein UlaG (beta-lactamase superfamily)